VSETAPSNVASTHKQKEMPERRAFFKWLTWLAMSFAAILLAIPLVGYLLGPLRRREKTWVNLGPVNRFRVGETLLATFVNPLRQPWDGRTAHTGVYVRRRADNQFLVFAVNCTHLGCPVSWFPQSGLFMCPCHGGVYYEDGERASGPPPRGLFHCECRVRDENLEIEAPHLPTLHDTLR
jgi:menaquinol-cytochrome c reductase iron-sulfur subunit